MIQLSQVKVPLYKIKKAVPEEYIQSGVLHSIEIALVKEEVAKKLKITLEEIKNIEIRKKSIDARKKDEIYFVYAVLISCDKEEKRCKYCKDNSVVFKKEEKRYTPQNSCTNNCTPLVVGLGPAGLFAAYILALKGKKPVVIERGMDVDRRKKEVEDFWSGVKELNPECNVQFGEGGAGTFSDGKLNTMTKDRDGYNRFVLETFVKFGAPEEILYLQKPHIGTDRLCHVVKNMRNEIVALGGQVHFETKLEKINLDADGKVCSVSCTGKVDEILCDTIILATGHSARDTFLELKNMGIEMRQKPFAVGVRMEHPQNMISKSMYGEQYSILPVASYKLTHTTKSGRGVYSFCMCPGGQVVNASSEVGRLAVNGMSNYRREGRNANSAIVVTIGPEDFDSEDVLAGMELQRQMEESAYRVGGGKVPVQMLRDFLDNKSSENLGEVLPDICGEYVFGNVRSILPKEVGDAIAESVPFFGKRIEGYDMPEAVVSGVESRTSSPIKMIRDSKSLQGSVPGLYPCGEGAGYAGGITSAAMDGIRVAEAICDKKDNMI